MAAPPGVTKNRWDQAVRAIARDTGQSNTDVDIWLNDVWAGMYSGDEVQGWIDGHARLSAWLMANGGDTVPTLPRAFEAWVT